MDHPRSLPPTHRGSDSANGPPAPVDSPVGSSGRRSFWSRIALRRGNPSDTTGSDSRAAAETLFDRLGAIEQRLGGVESAIDLSSERLETRLLQFWEIEEQLAQLSRRLGELEATQHDLAKRSTRLSNTVGLLAVFALLASLAALAIAFPPWG